MLLLCALVVGSSAWADKYVKVTSSDDLVDGAEYLLVSGTEAYSGISSNSGTHTTVTFNEDDEDEITAISDAHVLRLGGSTDEWTFYDESDEKYLAYTQTATSGSSYNRLYQVDSYTDNGATWTLTVSGTAVSFKNNYNTGRWIRYNSGYFRCYYSANGESTTGNAVTLYKKVSSGNSEPSISLPLGSTTINAPATAVNTTTIVVTYNNLTNYDADVIFYEADGTTVADDNDYSWMTAEINTTTKNLEYSITANTGAARTAYLRVYALGDEGDAESELITITQAGQPHDVNVATGLTGGTIEADPTSAIVGTTISLTAHPEDAYTFGSWSVYKTGDQSTTVTVSNNQFTMPAYAVTVTATFTAKPTYTATFSVNGNTTYSNTFYEGQAISFPSNPAAISGKSFVGWFTAEYTNANTAPEFVNTATATMGNNDVTYYAVFADVAGITEASWTETAIGSISSTDVIVISNGSYAMNNDNGTSNPPSVNSISVSGTSLSAAPNNNLKWNVSGNATDGYTFYPNGTTSTWLYCSTTASSSNNNNIRVGTGDRKVWKFDNSGYLVTNDNNTARYLSIYVENSTPKDFRGYTSTGNGAFVPKFYKYTAGSTTYANYSTSVIVLSESDLAITSSNPVALEMTTAIPSPTSTIDYTTSSTGAMSFVSDNTSVATVTSAGVITAVGQGTAKITISQVADASYMASGNLEVTVNVTDGRDACATGIDLPTAQKTLTKGDLDDFAATSTPAEGFTGTINYTYETSDADIVAVATGTYSAEAFGTADITITATPTGGNAANYKPASQVVTVTVIGTNSISLDPTTKTVTFSASTFDIAATVPTDNYNGTVSAVSDNTLVATVSVDGTTITVTPVAVGSAKITVTAGTDTYYPVTASAECNVTFTAPVGSATAPSSDVIIFEETFAKCASSGGNGDDGFAAASTTAITNNYDDYTDISGWTLSFGYPANACIKFGSGSKTGSATSPSITVENGKTYTLSFKAAPWGTETDKTMTVDVTGGTIEEETSVTTSSMTYGEWNYFTYDIVATGTSMTLAFSCSANRFFLDEVKVTKEGPAPTATVTLNKYGYATYCSVNPIDFSSTTGYTAWRVSEISGTTITFEKITGTIKGGQGVLLYNKDADGENSTDVTITFADGTKEFNQGMDDTNLLFGTTAPTYVSANEYYGLSGNTFVKVNEGKVPAGKALLPASVVPNEARLTFVFEDASGIANINVNDNDNRYYDLQGRRVAAPQKGLYIVNGKKVVMK